MNPKPIIALGGDGVLLDYHLAYQQAWGKTFGDLPKVKDPSAYWPKDRYEVRHLDTAELAYLRGFFDHQFWSSIPPIDNAIGACQMLVDAGYKLVCVTALDHQYQSARFKNLRDHNFPITHVLTAAQADGEISPNAKRSKILVRSPSSIIIYRIFEAFLTIHIAHSFCVNLTVARTKGLN